MRGVTAWVAAVLVAVTTAGWGTPLAAVRGRGDADAGRAVRALVAGRPATAAELPADLPERVETRRGLLVRADGGCSSPIGGGPFGFTDVCARHDLGCDLLRHAARRGDPLPGWARRLLDDQFAAGLADRCAETRGGPRCTVLAWVYVAVVRVNTARQGAGSPLTENPVRWAGAAVAGAWAGLLARRRAVHPPGPVPPGPAGRGTGRPTRAPR